MRIALIHALKHSIAPIEAAFATAWPEARLMNLLDDSLSADLARDGKLNDAMTDRFLALGDYEAETGANHQDRRNGFASARSSLMLQRPGRTACSSRARPSVPASRPLRGRMRPCRS